MPVSLANSLKRFSTYASAYERLAISLMSAPAEWQEEGGEEEEDRSTR